MKVTKTNAKRFALQKWRFLSKRTYPTFYDSCIDVARHNPSLKDLESHCSFCDLFYSTLCSCGECPLRDEGRICCAEFRAYRGRPTKQHAKLMYNKIKEVKL